MSDKQVFEIHFFSPQKDSILRYGIAASARVPATAVLLLLQGRAEFIEKYQGIAQHLQSKGFKVISLDWQGQGLSSRPLENRHKGHVERFDAYVTDLEIFYSRVVEQEDLPVYILAHSMGGHIALRFMSLHPAKIKKAVLATPMIDISFPAITRLFARFISRQLFKAGFAEKYAAGSKDYSRKQAAFKRNVLSHDPDKYQILHDEIEKNPDLALGGVTWGWLNAAVESIEQLKRDDVVHKITVPILMISARKDVVVSSKAQEDICKRLPKGVFLSIEGAFHELLFEAPAIDCQVWKAFDQFIFGRAPVISGR